MLFTPGNVTANTARLGAMNGAQKDRLIVKMATEIRSLKLQMQQLYQMYRLSQEAYETLYNAIMSRLDYIERLAGQPAAQQVSQTIQMPSFTPQFVPQQPIQTPQPQEPMLDQVDTFMAAAAPAGPRFEDTPMRPIATVNFEGAES